MSKRFANPILATIEAQNVHQVFDWLWCSGQVSESDVAKLAELGIDAVINLAPPTAGNALPGEAESVTQQGMTYVQIPVDWDQPRLNQLQQFFAALKLFDGNKVWVHCAKNMRASAFIYLYRRLCLAETEELSNYPMRDIWTPNPVWQAFICDALNVSKPINQTGR